MAPATITLVTSSSQWCFAFTLQGVGIFHGLPLAVLDVRAGSALHSPSPHFTFEAEEDQSQKPLRKALFWYPSPAL